MKNFGMKGAWAYPGTAQIFWVPPIISGTAKLQISNLASTFRGSIGIKAHEKFWKKGAWAYPGTAQIFWVPPIISGTGKATDFKFCMHIYGLNRKRSPLKIWEK